MKKKTLILGLGLALCLLLCATAVQAQEDAPYRVSLRRDFGYGNGADIQGNMTLRLVGDEDQVANVTFLMDGEILMRVDAPPFKFSFSTDTYPAAVHQLAAQVESKDGQVYLTKALTYRFLSGAQAQEGIKNILVPILVLTGLVLGLTWLIQYRPNKNKTAGAGGVASYGGYYGGAVCKQCAQPFQRSFLGMNMVIGRLERCPHCGKWQFTQRTSPQVLAEAERASQAKFEQEDSAPAEESRAEDLLDDTKFTDKI